MSVCVRAIYFVAGVGISAIETNSNTTTTIITIRFITWSQKEKLKKWELYHFRCLLFCMFFPFTWLLFRLSFFFSFDILFGMNPSLDETSPIKWFVDIMSLCFFFSFLCILLLSSSLSLSHSLFFYAAFFLLACVSITLFLHIYKHFGTYCWMLFDCWWISQSNCCCFNLFRFQNVDNDVDDDYDRCNEIKT